MSPFPTLFALKEKAWLRDCAQNYTLSYLLFAILSEFEGNLVFAVGAGKGNVLVLDCKGSLAVHLELKLVFFELVLAPAPSLGRDLWRAHHLFACFLLIIMLVSLAENMLI